MAEAHAQFVARRYQTAIDAYNDASDMIHAQLLPNYPIGISRQRVSKALSADLFDSLLSTGLEWMNVLPVRQPEVGARARGAGRRTAARFGAFQPAWCAGRAPCLAQGG
ncbi:MAG: hypothetical protein H7244_12235 [Herminiimonas sp.]|nr:hypothetical protein [Herminiimonas sp.]